MNIQKMMKQAQQMQKKMEGVQEELANSSYDGEAGSGLVKTVVNGKGMLQKLTIDPKIVDPDDIEMLEDLIIAACNDAKEKADADSEDKMGAVAGGMNLPF